MERQMPNGNDPRTDWLVRLVILSLYGILLVGWIVLAVDEGMKQSRAYERRHATALNKEIGELRFRCSSDISNLAMQHADDISRVDLEPHFSRWRVELQDEYETALRSWEDRRARRTGLSLYDSPPLSPEIAIDRCVSKIQMVANFRSITGYDPIGEVLRYLAWLLLIAILAVIVGVAAFKAIDWHHRTHGLVRRKWQRALLVSVPAWWILLLLAVQPSGLIWGPFFLTWGLMVPAICYVFAWLFMQHLMPWIRQGH
jgi:ABC-type multidrug transport system fused ATPase/permease subunit